MSCDAEDEMQRASDELDKFDKVIIGYYNTINNNPRKVISETQELIDKVKTEADPNNVKWNKLGSLFELRAETFYRIGEYENSIKEIYNDEQNNVETLKGEFSFSSQDCIHLACNYAKLKDYGKTKTFIDSAGRGWYIVDFINANYYELIGDKDKALKAYLQIKNDKSIDHYEYYQDALKRIAELNKPKPKLLDELFYPSARSDNEICKTDNARRDSVFKIVYDLPEVKACASCDVVSIYKEPDETNSSNYWIKVGHDNGSSLVSQFNFYVDTLTYEIKYLDTQTDKILTLEEWRKSK